jgi:hypothetical protein
MYRTLKDLPAAKKEFRRFGFQVVKLNKVLIGGRPAYKVTDPDGIWNMVTDYGLLRFASA